MRPSIIRPINPALVAAAAVQAKPSELTAPYPLWQRPEGIRRDVPASQLGLADAWDMRNMRIYRGSLYARSAVQRIGNIIPAPVLSTTMFVTAENVEYLHAFTTTGVYELVGSTWVALSGTPLTAGVYAHYSHTAWNNKLVYANGFDKIGEVDNVSRTFAAIAAAPRARHITTFAGRIIAGYVEGSPNRIQWSVRNNNADWTGLGSGYEDLLSTPGGVVDAVRGIFPVSDYDALVVRSRSLWLMRQTGDPFVPFSFTHLFILTGTISPWTLTSTPEGVVGLMRDDVYILTTSSTPEPIGERVRDELVQGTQLDFATGCWDAWRKEYCISIPEANQTTVWRCKLLERPRKWTKDVYQFPSKRIQSAIYRTAISMDELTGTMEDLEGPFELLGLQAQRMGVILTTGIANQSPLWEDSSATLDNYPDSSVADVGVGFEVWSGQLGLTSALHKMDLAEVVFEYTSTRAITVWLDVSGDGGTTWERVGDLVVPVTTATNVARILANRTVDRLMLRLVASDAVGFRLVAAYPRLAEGGEVAY